MTTTPAGEIAWCYRRLAEIRAKYTRPDEALYLRLLIAAWEYHIAILEAEAQRTSA